MAMSIALPSTASAQSGASDLAPRLLFAISGGFWKGATTLNTSIDDAAKASGKGDPAARGYYRISAYRTEDNSSHLYLQRVALEESAPKVLQTIEIEEINDLHAYVTDIRQDNGSAAEGFSGFVTLKRDPKQAQTETWTVFVDEYGTVTVEKPTN
jgi:hypothetical protein